MSMDMFTTIDNFHDGVHDFLSNFYLAPVVLWGVGFPSTEHAYQWAKTHDAREKEYILWRNVKLDNPLSAPNGIHTTCYTSKKRGTEVTLRADWEQVKYDIMVEVCRAKFEQHPDLAEKLIATGDAMLVEGNTWHDNTWGSCVCDRCASKTKLNLLGKALMQVRAELEAKCRVS